MVSAAASIHTASFSVRARKKPGALVGPSCHPVEEGRHQLNPTSRLRRRRYNLLLLKLKQQWKFFAHLLTLTGARSVSRGLGETCCRFRLLKLFILCIVPEVGMKRVLRQTMATFLNPDPLHTPSDAYDGAAATIHAAAFYCPLDAVAAAAAGNYYAIEGASLPAAACRPCLCCSFPSFVL